MKEKFFFQLFLILLLIGFVSGAGFQGSFQISTGGNQILISSGICQEDWTGSFWTNCVNGIQTFVCLDKNNCGTTNLKPQNCNLTQNCTVQQQPSGGTSSGGGNGGPSSSGGSSVIYTTPSTTEKSCIENWTCEDWSNLKGQCGQRICNDADNCGTTLLKPTISKECSSSFFIGSVIKGFSDFAKSTPGVISITFIVIVLSVAMVTLSRKKMKEVISNKEQTEQKTEEKKPTKNKSTQ